ncbi:ornithine carbamoyltransferase [Streptococcus agalactiae COH1]|nr:ornithine carbamoyltransferase [Streptococcus agalactiae COH1]
MLNMTENPNVIFEHCLPSFHNIDTKVGYDIYEKYGLKEMEVSDEVLKPSLSCFQKLKSYAYYKAVMVATLGD